MMEEIDIINMEEDVNQTNNKTSTSEGLRVNVINLDGTNNHRVDEMEVDEDGVEFGRVYLTKLIWKMFQMVKMNRAVKQN